MIAVLWLIGNGVDRFRLARPAFWWDYGAPPGVDLLVNMPESTEQPSSQHRRVNNPPRPTFPTFAYIFGILMTMLGAAIFFLTSIGYKSFVSQRDAAQWPTAQGTIVASELQSKESDDDESSSTMYNAKVVTEYKVDGFSYRIKEIYIGQSGSWTSNYGSVARQRKRFKKGRSVTVYVKPGRPSIATLEPGVKPWTYAMLIMGVVFAIMGLISLGYALKATYGLFRHGLLQLTKKPD